MSATTQVANEAPAASLKETKLPVTTNKPLSPTDMRCPDPSAHVTKSTMLQDQASAAALYSTRSQKGENNNLLDADGKLSSASAATSLKHARAHDLPSYPIVGIEKQNSGLTAATLAHSNAKSPSYPPPPEKSDAAGKAALLAHEHKMQESWKPEPSAAGSKAALLAHRDGVKLNHWKPESNPHGNSAATIAFQKHGSGQPVDNAHAEDVKKKALIAATGAHSTAGRKRAQSSPSQPPAFPDSQNSARNALSAATIAHSPSVKSAVSPRQNDPNRMSSGAMEAARIQHSKSVSRDMYSSHPPVALEVEEKNRQNALRAAAISTAKQMYEITDHQRDDALKAATHSHAQTASTTAHGQQRPSSEADLKQQALRYIGVQEAAQKLAAERLAKMDAENSANFRNYYGYEKPRSKLSIRGRRARRGSASSDPERADSDDEIQARRVRSQMSVLNKSLAELDKQREQDRKNLLAAAQRKVDAQMHGIDQKIFNETGKMSPAMIEEWDAKARAKAAAASEQRMANHGKVHIGGGKYIDQADVDAVAAARIQPTLDEIAEKTEKRKAQEEEARLDAEEQKRQAQIDKERATEIKLEEKKAKDEERKIAKARTTEEKAAVKQEKEAEKSKKAEEKRLAKEAKRKSRTAPIETGETTIASPTSPTIPTEPPSTSYQHLSSEQPEKEKEELTETHPQPSDSANASQTTSPTSPTSKDGKGFRSLLNKFKRRSKHSEPGFIGGKALRASSSHSQSLADSQPTSPRVESSSAAPVPIGGRHQTYSDVSSLDEPASEDEEQNAKWKGKGKAGAERGRPAERKDSIKSESSSVYEEAGELAPPPVFRSERIGSTGSPSGGSRFKEIGI